MKKIFAMFMAAAMAASLAMTSFAADPVTAIKVDADENGVVLADGLLTPGEEYQFPLKVTVGGVDVDLDKTIMDTHKTSVSITKGSTHISSAKIEADAGKYFLVVTTKAGWDIKKNDAAVKVRLLDKTSSAEVTNMVTEFKTGYNSMDQATIDGLTEGEYVVVDPTKPVITESQLSKISKLNNYKNVTFTHDDWKFTVNPVDSKAVNLVSNSNIIKEIVTKYNEDDRELKFASFPAGVDFGISGKVELDVSDEADAFDGKYFVYRYLNGKLSSIKSTFNEDENSLTFSTQTLGRFVITNKEIKNTVVDGGNTGSGSGSDTNKNPDTGANDVVGVAVVLAIVSLAAAGAVSLKKKSSK